MNFHEEARKLEMVREDRKWYENEAAIEQKLREAYDAGLRDGEIAAGIGINGRELWRGQADQAPRDFYRGQAYEEG